MDCKNCGHPIGHHSSYDNGEGCEDCDCTWMWVVKEGTALPQSLQNCPNKVFVPEVGDDYCKLDKKCCNPNFCRKRPYCDKHSHYLDETNGECPMCENEAEQDALAAEAESLERQRAEDEAREERSREEAYERGYIG